MEVASLEWLKVNSVDSLGLASIERVTLLQGDLNRPYRCTTELFWNHSLWTHIMFVSIIILYVL